MIQTKMMDMARPKPKKEDMAPTAGMVSEGYEKYPYCLRITLQGEELSSLGMSMKDFAMGKSCMIHTEAEVISMRESERQGQKSDQSVELQIKKMMVEPAKKSQSDKVKAGMDLVGKMKEGK